MANINGSERGKRLPDAESVFVEERKITHYLLSSSSEDGRHKAAFFLRFGFTVADWRILADALCHHGRTHKVVQETDNGKYGRLFVVEGAILSPDGRNPGVRTIWEVTDKNPSPRLITAYPL